MNLPYSVQIELTQGCTRFCDYCGIRSIWEPGDKNKFMDVDTAIKVSNSLSRWIKKFRIEFAMYGEPTLNPNIFEIISIIRNKNPKASMMINTNGDVLFNKSIKYEKIKKLFDCGINVIALNVYDDNLYNPIKKYCKKNIDFAELKEYYKGFNYYCYHNPLKTKKIVMVKNITEFGKKSRNIYNHGGNVPYKNIKRYLTKKYTLPLNKICVNPFREIIIRYNGDMCICCADVKCENKIGHIEKNTSLGKIWFGKNMNLIRKKLIDGKRKDIMPCSKCSYHGGFRIFLAQRWFQEKIK